MRSTKPKLDLQRDVVRNERRQTIENRPYGKVELRLPELLYPESHPYHHPVIGSHGDLEAAGVKDVQELLRSALSPLQRVAGDRRQRQAGRRYALAERYFGFLPPPAADRNPASLQYRCLFPSSTKSFARPSKIKSR